MNRPGGQLVHRGVPTVRHGGPPWKLRSGIRKVRHQVRVELFPLERTIPEAACTEVQGSHPLCLCNQNQGQDININTSDTCGSVPILDHPTGHTPITHRGPPTETALAKEEFTHKSQGIQITTVEKTFHRHKCENRFYRLLPWWVVSRPPLVLPLPRMSSLSPWNLPATLRVSPAMTSTLCHGIAVLSM